jgi:excisionase family DNA binding protein
VLRISEAAARLGVTATTLRRWEVEGRIHPARTPGGERRYPDEELERVEAESGSSPKRRHGKRIPGGRRPADPKPLVGDTEDDVDFEAPRALLPPVLGLPQRRSESPVRGIDDDVAALEQAERQARAARDRREREAARVADDQTHRQEAQRAKVRLDGLRQYGDMLAAMSGAPTEYRAAVTRDLVGYVTAAQFPTSATFQAHEYIKDRVERILQPWRDEQEQEREVAAREVEQQRRRDQREDLRAIGRTHAQVETLSWDAGPRARAIRDVDRALREEVRSDWTRDDVIDLVDDVLDEWE